jgi:transcription-repair coupling factor (superfamily II helicase)
LIIDEEQRFGVGHKETVKDLKRTVDVLTMTATPIPRTLEMSLVGIRDMSTIHTPPEERYPVNTYVVEYSEELLREVVTREIARNGQAYVVYNRVRRMERFVSEMRELIPEARITMAHGQMPERVLESAMMDFYSGEADVLVCSTIIENGLDIPRANTVLLCDADRLGLAQLYQLRGRVGRSPRAAYCYLTFRPQKQISETAEKRLEAIREFTELGSGLKIAMRDLEIRGAGNLLGPEQHGYMANVGYDTYCRLLARAVKEAKGESPEIEIETTVDVPVTAYIPHGYIASHEQKVQAYRRVAGIDGEETAKEVADGLRDRYGKLPPEVESLMIISLLRAKLNKLGVQAAVIRDGSAKLRFSERAQPDLDAIIRACNAYGKGASILGGQGNGILLRDGKSDAAGMMEQAMLFIADIA